MNISNFEVSFLQDEIVLFTKTSFSLSLPDYMLKAGNELFCHFTSFKTFGLSQIIYTLNKNTITSKKYLFEIAGKTIESSSYEEGATKAFIMASEMSLNLSESNIDFDSCLDSMMKAFSLEIEEGMGLKKELTEKFKEGSFFDDELVDQSQLSLLPESFVSLFSRDKVKRAFLLSAFGISSVSLNGCAGISQNIKEEEIVLASQNAVFTLSEAQKATIDKRVLPVVEKFITRMQGTGIDLYNISRLSFIKIIPEEEFMKTFDKDSYEKNNMAVSYLYKDKETPFLMYFSDRLLKNENEMEGFIVHELLHVIGYDHPVQPCAWDRDGCSIMGSSDEKAKVGYNKMQEIIEKSLKPHSLKKLPKLPISTSH